MTAQPGASASARRLVTGLAAGLATLLALGLLAVGVGAASYLAPGPRARAGAATTVLLRKGAGLTEIAGVLKRQGAIASAPAFLVAAQATGAARRLKPGEYLIPSRASLAEVLRRIRSGEIVHHRVTLPEGVTSRVAVETLNAAEVLTGDAPTPPEGALLPETYDVVRGQARAVVLQQMMDARDRLLAELWAKRQAGLPYATPEDAVILASIVEKETSKPEERPRVAAVYLNRLRIGMKLDADPTLIYGITGGKPLGRGLKVSELQADAPYNTYVRVGLPPTPIGNPGRASLAAVLDPPHTQELYFGADGSGGHAFARTLEEQDANVARWRKLMKAREAQAKTVTSTTTTASSTHTRASR